MTDPYRLLLLGLTRICRDRRAGANQLAGDALRLLAREVADWPTLAPEIVRSRAGRVAKQLRRTQPAMGTFRQWAAEWRRLSESHRTRDIPRIAARWVRRTESSLGSEPGRVASIVARALPSQARVLTLSRSTTILRSLLETAPDARPPMVLVLESRRGGEGRAMARDLRAGGLKAQVVPDQTMRSAVAQVDLVLVGADAVESDGSVVHKVGTHRLAFAAHRAGIPFVVVAGGSKRVTAETRHPPLPRLFDRTPPRLVTAFWTDRGVTRGRAEKPPRLRSRRRGRRSQR